MSKVDAKGVPWRPDCQCWCQVRPVVCTLAGCECIIHDDHAATD